MPERMPEIMAEKDVRRYVVRYVRKNVRKNVRIGCQKRCQKICQKRMSEHMSEEMSQRTSLLNGLLKSRRLGARRLTYPPLYQLSHLILYLSTLGFQAPRHDVTVGITRSEVIFFLGGERRDVAQRWTEDRQLHEFAGNS